MEGFEISRFEYRTKNTAGALFERGRVFCVYRDVSIQFEKDVPIF